MGFLKWLHSWLGRQIGGRPTEVTPDDSRETVGKGTTADIVSLAHQDTIVEVDEDLLDRCKTQWQFGDWESLTKLSEPSIQNHPDRAKLALLAAAGHQQVGTMQDTHDWVRRAYTWGCKPKLIKQVLISGTHNTLARAAALVGDEKRSLAHFEASADTGSRYTSRLVTRVRVESQLTQLGLSGTPIPPRFSR